MIRLNRRLISATVSGISPGSGGGGWSGRVGSGAGGRWRVAACAAVTAQTARGGHGQHGVAQQGGVAADLGVVESEVVLAELEILLARPTQAGHRDQGGQRDGPPGWDVAVVVGQLTGQVVAADEQEMLRAGGAHPGPGVAALAWSAPKIPDICYGS